DVPVQQGLGCPRRGDGVHHVQLQLLLAGADAAGAGPRGPVAAADAGDGRGPGRPCLAPGGVAYPTGRATVEGHHQADPPDPKVRRTRVHAARPETPSQRVAISVPSPSLHFARSPLVWERETPRKPGLVANNARFGGASKPCRNLPPHEIAGKTATPRGRHSRKVQTEKKAERRV